VKLFDCANSIDGRTVCYHNYSCNFPLVTCSNNADCVNASYGRTVCNLDTYEDYGVCVLPKGVCE